MFVFYKSSMNFEPTYDRTYLAGSVSLDVFSMVYVVVSTNLKQLQSKRSWIWILLDLDFNGKTASLSSLT
jgi:hypothetical protein